MTIKCPICGHDRFMIVETAQMLDGTFKITVQCQLRSLVSNYRLHNFVIRTTVQSVEKELDF